MNAVEYTLKKENPTLALAYMSCPIEILQKQEHKRLQDETTMKNQALTIN